MRKSLILEKGLRIQRCGNWHRAFTNPFASSSINFGFALKLLRIKDQWYKVLVKCQFVCNRDLSVLTSEGSVMALDEVGFLLAAFRKVKKIGKGLRSNGTSNIAETDSPGLGKTERIALMRAFLCWHFTRASRPLVLGFLSRYSDILSGSLRSGWLRLICFKLSGQFCKYDKDSCIKSVKFPS